MLARISSAVLVQTNGFGLCALRNFWIAALSARTLRWAPCLIWRSVSSTKCWAVLLRRV